MSEKPAEKPKASRWRRFWRFAWKAFIVYVLVSLALSFIPEGDLPVKELSSEVARVSGDLLAGAGKAVITPPEEWWGRMNLYNAKPPIKGVADDLSARALSFSAPDSANVVTLASIDLLIVPPGMPPAVKKELERRGLKAPHLTLTATHTHSGAGNFWDPPFGESYMGVLRPEYVELVVKRTADAIERSIKSMRPARVGFASIRTAHLVKQRRYRDPQTDLPPPVDEDLGVMRVDAKAGGVIAYALNFGAHPTALNHLSGGKISGDFPGAISTRLEAAHPGAVAVFLQGAEGSVRSTSPPGYRGYKDIPEAKFAKVAMQGDMLAYYVAEAEKGMAFEDKLDAAAATLVAALPGTDAHFFPEERPWLAVRVLTIIPNWLMNRALAWMMVPERTAFQAVRINHAYFFAFPCDLSNRLGWDIKQLVRRDHVFILGQANDYSMGYVLAREEYDMGGAWGLAASERGQDYFGKRAGPFCIKVVALLADRVKEPGASDPLFFGVGDEPNRLPDGTRVGGKGDSPE